MFSDELDQIIDLADPDEMAHRLDELDRKLAQAVDSYNRLDQAVGAVRVSATHPSGAVTATVDADGTLVELTTTAAIGRVRPDQVGPAVLETIQRAQSGLADRIGEVAHQSVGTDDPLAGHIVSTFRDRYPEPVVTDPRRVDPPPRPIGQLAEDGWADQPIDWQRG